MKSMFFIKQKLWLLVVIFSLAAVNQKVEAIIFVSNLGDFWTEAGIGDIEGLFPGGNHYGTDTAFFTTGAGNFSVNAITLEFADDSSYSAPQWVNVQLFQQTGRGNLLLGSFGNPVVNPTPTQWPQSSHPNAYTTFIDFSPLGQINLNSFSQYSVVVSMPAKSPVAAALMFANSSAYTSPANWTMSATTSGNPYALGEYLIMAVNATSVPEPSVFGLLALGCLFFGFRRSK